MTDTEIITKFNLDFTTTGDIGKTVAQSERLLQTLKTLGIEGGRATDILTKVLNRTGLDPRHRSEAIIQARNNFDQKESEKFWNAHNTEEKRKRREEEEAYRKDRRERVKMQRLAGVVSPFAFLSPKSGINVQQLLNNVTRLVPKMQGLTLAFTAGKAAWDFAAAVAEINTKIIQLGASSGLSTQKLVDLGAAVTAFGGSAEKVAQGSERFIMTIEKMKRGGGLGYLGDVAYKYGFSADMSADWEQNNKAAIDYARQMIAMGNKTGAMAFLKDWDSANYTSNMLKASMSAEHVAANDAYYERYDRLGDVDAASKATQEYNEETAKLSRAWTAVSNQLATMLLPLMTGLVRVLRGIADFFARHRGILKAILITIGVIAGVLAVLAGPWVALVAAITFIASVLGMKYKNPARTQGLSKASKDSISVNDIKAGGANLNARTRYGLSHQLSEVSAEAKKNANMAEILGSISTSATKINNQITENARQAMTVQDMEQTMVRSMNSMSVDRSVRKNTVINNNMELNQTFNGVDKEAMDSAKKDTADTLGEAVKNASRTMPLK